MEAEKLIMADVDYNTALVRFVGNRELYEKYLKKFVDDEHILAAQAAYENSDYTELLEQVHALKGVTGTLGILSLQRMSTEIVSALRMEKYDGLKERMKELAVEFDRICEVIKHA